MEALLKKAHNRRAFFTIIILVLTVTSLIRGFVIPIFEPTLVLTLSQFFAMFFEGLIVSLIVTVFIGGFIFWLTPDVVKNSTMEVIDPKEIGSLLGKATSTSNLWTYKGACGRYLRASVLPNLAIAAKNESIGRDIKILIMNPDNESLCQEYATYRRSLKSASEGEPWTAKRVRNEIVATVVAALYYRHAEPLLGINIYLVDNFSAFRFDISDNYVIVTKEDREASALRADSGTYFYKSYRDDVRLTERQSSKVRYSWRPDASGDLTTQIVTDILDSTKLVHEDKRSDIELDQVIEMVLKPKDPYRVDKSF